MKKSIPLFLGLSLLLLSGCASSEQTAKIANLEQKLTEMQAKLDQQETEFTKKLEEATAPKAEPQADTQTPTNAKVAPESSFIRILSPKNQAILREEPFFVSGETSNDCDKIVANSKNDEYKINDTYTLQTYKRGSTTFKLGVKHEWKNLDVGKNVYTLTATCDGGTKTTSVTVFFEASGGAEMGKPVIYLYPTQEQKTFVLPKPENGVTVSEPALGSGWNVTAFPDGKIVDQAGKAWPYLFWEGFSNLETPKEGFLVRKNGLGAFFDDKLSLLGLNAKEIADFKEFWLRKLNEDKYYLISFVSQTELDQHAPLQVEPKPDTAIRVFFDYSTSDKPFAHAEQTLEKGPARNGFTLVEWGGELH